MTVLQIETSFWAVVEKAPEPISISNPTGKKLTENALVQTIKFALRRQVLGRLHTLDKSQTYSLRAHTHTNS